MEILVKKLKKFSLYMESPNSLYLPRFYGQDKLGLPNKNKINEGTPITIKFNGSLRKEQEPIVKLYHDLSNQERRWINFIKMWWGKNSFGIIYYIFTKSKNNCCCS